MKAAMTILFWLLSLFSSAQSNLRIYLHGIVTEYYTASPLKDVRVHIADDEAQMDIITKKDGGYNCSLEKGKLYHVTFSKQGMVSKRVDVDGRTIPDDADASIFDMDLQMTMFEEIPDFSFVFFDEPIGAAVYKHSVRNLSWDNTYSEARYKLMDIVMREYRKTAVGYYERSNKRPVVIADSMLVLNDDNDQQVMDQAIKSFVPKDTMYYDQKGSAPAKQVEGMIGLFFTVQVGVYSKPTQLDELFNITPLNSELMDGRRIRYTSGVFGLLEEAESYRKEVVLKGVKDAFIVAYFNGIRIPLDEGIYLRSKFGDKIVHR